uniref:Uncharacterized protein n=2 Tax=Lepeophtheirus salmonis TaxID=72036 RepID=A0A0K2VK20_LEPSM
MMSKSLKLKGFDVIEDSVISFDGTKINLTSLPLATMWATLSTQLSDLGTLIEYKQLKAQKYGSPTAIEAIKVHLSIDADVQISVKPLS